MTVCQKARAVTARLIPATERSERVGKEAKYPPVPDLGTYACKRHDL